MKRLRQGGGGGVDEKVRKANPLKGYQKIKIIENIQLISMII